MADANQAAEDLARTLQRLNDDLAQYGKFSQQSQEARTDAEMKAKYGIENFTKGMATAAGGIMALGSAGMSAGKAMLDGKKGAAAFNSSLDDMSKAAEAAGLALTLLIPGGPLIKGLIAGITLAATAYIKYTQAANEMADKMYKGYQGLAKAGGAAADGMTGVKASAQKLNLSMNDLDQLVSLVAENSKDFALFAGSVSQGRKAFADIGEQVHKSDQALFNMGLTVKDINEGTAGYLKLQTRLGNAQKMTTDQLAKGAVDYLKEQDALTKLTGQSRAEMEQQRERALQKEQFAAKIRELQMNGQTKAAESLLKLNSIYEAAGPETASAFQASVTGNLSNRDAQKANLASQGEMIRSTQQVIDGQISYQEAAQRTGKAMSATADTVGTTLGQLGVYNENFGNLAEQLKLGQLAQGDIVANMTKIKTEQAAQLAGKDGLTAAMGELTTAQINATKATENFVSLGMASAIKGSIALANATRDAANALTDVFGGKGKGLTEQEKKQDEAQWQAMTTGEKAMSSVTRGIEYAGKGVAWLVGLVSNKGEDIINNVVTKAERERIKGEGEYLKGEGRNVQPVSNSIPKGADGGLFSGPTSGYLAMLHGNELVIPEDKLGGMVQTGGAETGKGEISDKLQKVYQEIFKDTKTLEKLTDTDLKKTQAFSRLQNKVYDLKTSLLDDEVELLEEQNDQLREAIEAAEKIGGKEMATQVRRNAIMARMNMGGMGGQGSMGSGITPGGGTGLQMPSAPAAPGMGGAQGMTSGSEDQLKKMGFRLAGSDVQNEGAQLSPKLIELAKQIQATVPGFRAFTGFNDKYHIKANPSSQHLKGLAVDFVVDRQPSKEEGAKMVEYLKGLGASYARDEYNNAVSWSSGGHFHAQVPSLEDGGIAYGPEAGYPATLHGEEAVIPLNNNSGNFVKLFESMAESNGKMVAMMEELVRAQKNSVDVQNKMLRAQA